MMRDVIAAAVVLASCMSGLQADAIAYLSGGKLWVHESGESRQVGQQWQYQDVKWLRRPSVAVVRAGNVEVVDTATARTEKKTSLGNIRNVAVLPDRSKLVFTRIVGRDPEALREGYHLYYHDLYGLSLDTSKASRIGRLAAAGSIESMFVVGSDVYYLTKVGNGDGSQDIMKISLVGAKRQHVYGSEWPFLDEICSVCPDKSGKQLRMLAMKMAEDDTTLRNVWNLFVATFELQKPKPRPMVSCRLNPTPFRSYNEFVDGSCVLSDGALVFGLRNSDGSSRLYRLPSGSNGASVITEGYRPDATPE